MTPLLDRLRGHVTRADLLRLAASFVLAVLLWGWVTTSQDPEIDKTFPSVDVSVPELPGNLRVVSTIPPVAVRITGPRSVVDNIGPADVNATVRLSQIAKPGTYDVGITVTTSRSVRQRAATPSHLTIVVEETASKQLPLTFLPPALPDNDPRRIGELQPSVSEVTVSGARSAVDRVARVVLPIDIGTHANDFDGDFTPVAQDQQGVAIPEVTITPNTVRVHVPVSQRGRSVAVIATLSGEPAAGYEVVARTINPQTVLVDGPSNALNRLISVSTEPVNIAGATNNVSAHVKIDPASLPAGVTILQPTDGAVDVVVQIAQRGVTQALPPQPIQILGLGAGLTATLSPDQVGVVIVATQEQLASLHSGDIVISLNLAGLGPGTYTLTPTVSVPPNVRWLATDPQSVSVTITRGGPASPAARPAARPSPGPTAPRR